jgi:hypothetical protein
LVHVVQGMILQWSKIGAGINWELKYEDKLVASLRTKLGLAYGKYDGNYDGRNVTILEKLGSTEMIDAETKETICRFVGLYDVVLRDPRSFSLVPKGSDYQFLEGDNRILAATRYRRGAFTISASFTVFDLLENDPNPWLLALIGLYGAISDSALMAFG